MTEPTTPTGKRLTSGAAIYYDPVDILAIEQEAAAAERERLISEGWHEPSPDSGPVKAVPHEHTYFWSITGSLADPTPPGVPCIGCGHRYGEMEP